MVQDQENTSEAQLLQKVISVITGITQERSFSKIFREIVYTAGEVTSSQGKTLYLMDEESQTLKAVVLQNTVLGLESIYNDFDPNKIEGFISLPLYQDGGKPNRESIATNCALEKKLINLPDLDLAHGYDLNKVKAFDKSNNYQTKSMLALPLFSHGEAIVGVLQLINPNNGEELSSEQLDFARILASLLGAALSNSIYILSFKNLIDSVVRMVSLAIDEKSPHTAGHCHRVTELALELASAVNKHESGPYKNFKIDDTDIHQLEIAALLHDIGKIITPQHILDKSTKLEAICDRIDVIHERFLLFKKEKEIEFLRQKLADNSIQITPEEQKRLDGIKSDINEDFDFLSSLNTNEIFLNDEVKEKLDELAKHQVGGANEHSRPLLSKQELYNLSIPRGTLNSEERHEMENHVSITIRLLSSLPWPKELRDVTEYAGGHHENANGTGYPNHLTNKQMSVPAKILAIVDRFEGLSAPDRPYKREMSLSTVMRIMNAMNDDNELDEELYRIFLADKVYLDYARRHLPTHLIDMG